MLEQLSESARIRAMLVLWSLIVLVSFSNSRASQLQPPLSIAAGLAGWSAWAFLLPLLIQADRRLPVRRDALIPRLGFYLVLSVVFSFAFAYLDLGFSLVLNVPGAGGLASPLSTGRLPIAWLIYWISICGYLSYDYRQQLTARGAETGELERLLADSRLQTLRSQLNPHFIFNALNTISAHVEGAPRTARWMLEQLGDLLRLLLDHAEEQEISLQQELTFIDRYMKLQKIRFDDRLDVILDVDPSALRALVPTFILQPLLENAIRHGFGNRSDSGLIEIRAWRANTALHLSVQDDGPGLPPGWTQADGLGVGLSNTRERLRRLYDDRQSFEIAGNSTGPGVQVTLTFPFREADR